MLMIADDQNNQLPIRQAAIVNMKTFIERSWEGEKHQRFQIPENEKHLVRSSLLNALIRCVQTKVLRTQYEDLFYKIGALDFPAKWPELLPAIIMNLQGKPCFINRKQ